MPDKELVLIVDRQGRTRHLVDHPPSALMEMLGPVTTIYRNSHVEPTAELSADAVVWVVHNDPQFAVHLREQHWWADLLPVGGPVLGPFCCRELALDAEVKWLQEHHLPQKVHDSGNP